MIWGLVQCHACLNLGVQVGRWLCLPLVSSFLSPNAAALTVLWCLSAVPTCPNAVLLLWGNKLMSSWGLVILAYWLLVLIPALIFNTRSHYFRGILDTFSSQPFHC